MKKPHKIILFIASVFFCLPISCSFLLKLFPQKSYFTLHPNDNLSPEFSRAHKEIHDAIEKGDLDKTKKIFKEKNFKINPDNPFIHLAVIYGQKHIVEYFLDQGASPNEPFFLEHKPFEYRLKTIEVFTELPFLTRYSSKSGITELLFQRGENLSINLPSDCQISEWAFKSRNTDALEFLLFKAGAKEICTIAPKNLMAKEKTAYHKFQDLNDLVSNKKSSPDINYPKLFGDVWFCRSFFEQKDAARFANTYGLKDCNRDNVTGALLKIPALFIDNPEFVPTVLATVALCSTEELPDFCKKLLLHPGKSDATENKEPKSSQFLKTIKMAKRLHNIYKKTKSKKTGWDENRKNTHKFLDTTSKSTLVLYNLSKHPKIPHEIACEIAMFSDGNFGKEPLIKPQEKSLCHIF